MLFVLFQNRAISIKLIANEGLLILFWLRSKDSYWLQVTGLGLGFGAIIAIDTISPIYSVLFRY